MILTKERRLEIAEDLKKAAGYNGAIGDVIEGVHQHVLASILKDGDNSDFKDYALQEIEHVSSMGTSYRLWKDPGGNWHEGYD